MLVKVVLVAAFVTLASASCDLPPRFWCDSKRIARKCGVELQCAERFWVEESEVKPVMLDLYFESLCPGCRQFLTTMLYPTWRKFFHTKILQLRLFPYGNAHETQGSGGLWNFTCQHGPQECVGNLIENCIQKYTKDNATKYFPIFYCMESSSNPVKAAEMCVTKAKLNWDQINKCASGPEGNALMHQAAVATENLKPPHKYVPWVVVNGEHTEAMQQEAQNNLTKLLCDTYKGMKPKQCMETVPKHQSVSYKREKLTFYELDLL